MAEKCAFHEDRDATGKCEKCGKPLCEECTLLIKGKPYCSECAKEAISGLYGKHAPERNETISSELKINESRVEESEKSNPEFTPHNNIKEGNTKISTVCPSCNGEISGKPKICPNCGHKIKRRGGKILLLVILSIIIITGAITAVILKYNYEANLQREAELLNDAFKSGLIMISVEGLDLAVKCEEQCNMIRSIWYNAIYEESDVETDPYTIKYKSTYTSDAVYYDFNDALRNYMGSDKSKAYHDFISETSEKISNSLVQMERNIDSIDKQLVNDFKYVKDFGESVINFSIFALSADGSLKTYSEQFGEIDNEVIYKYKLAKSHVLDVYGYTYNTVNILK